MTRKDYLMLSQTMRLVRPSALQTDHRAQWCIDMVALATALYAANPRFERDRFMVDCGADDCEMPKVRL